MKAVYWYGANDVRLETVSEPKIFNPRNAKRQLHQSSAETIKNG